MFITVWCVRTNWSQHFTADIEDCCCMTVHTHTMQPYCWNYLAAEVQEFRTFFVQPSSRVCHFLFCPLKNALSDTDSQQTKQRRKWYAPGLLISRFSLRCTAVCPFLDWVCWEAKGLGKWCWGTSFIAYVFIFQHIFLIVADWPLYNTVTYLQLTILEIQFCFWSRKTTADYANTTETLLLFLYVADFNV